MRVEHLNPFIVAGVETLDRLLGGNAEPGQIAVRSAMHTTEQVSLLVGITGELSGQVLYSMSQVTATIVASAMLGQQHVAFDALSDSAVCELANIICGRAVTLLATAGWESEPTPVRVIRGANIEVLRKPALVYTFHSKCGRIDVSLALAVTADHAMVAGGAHG